LTIKKHAVSDKKVIGERDLTTLSEMFVESLLDYRGIFSSIVIAEMKLGEI